jgi:NADH pyrophosphatase NudC (nudix superfamily)
VVLSRGEVEACESQREALVRELREELSCRVEPIQHLMTQTKRGGSLILECWSAAIAAGEPVPNPLEVANLAWLTPAEIQRQPDLLRGTLEILDTIDPALAPPVGQARGGTPACG